MTIYDYYGKIKYIGDFLDFKYNGKGCLYYKNKYYEKDEKIYFDGIFGMDKFIKGTLFSPKGDKLYEGEFIDNYPKEGKNITIYNINGNIEYIGDFFNGKFNGYGKLLENREFCCENFKYEGQFKDGFYHGLGKGKVYKDKYSEFLYEGNFIEGKMEGNGKLFYEGGKSIFYEGTFKDNDLNGKGIIYYFNKSKKIEGIFDTLNKCKGIYYDPHKNKIYEGSIKNGIPENWDNAFIYNNYCYLIYKGKIKDGVYNGKGIEFSNCIENLILHEGIFKNNYCIDPDFNFNKESLKVVLLSQDCWPGKTCLQFRITDNYYLKDYYSTTSSSYSLLEFEINNYICQINIWDTNSRQNVRSFIFHFMRDAEIVLYLIDLAKLEGLDEYFFEEIKLKFSKETLLYLVVNKIDLIEDGNCEYFDNHMRFRKKAESLIENKKINY